MRLSSRLALATSFVLAPGILLAQPAATTAPITAQEIVARYIAARVTDEGPARLIEQLVLASPADALAASGRLAAEAIERRAASA